MQSFHYKRIWNCKKLKTVPFKCFKSLPFKPSLREGLQAVRETFACFLTETSETLKYLFLCLENYGRNKRQKEIFLSLKN